MLLKSALRLLRRRGAGAKSAIDQARALYAKGDVRGAIPLFRKYLEQNPHDVPAINDLATCLHDAGSTEEAYRYFDLAFALDEGDLPTLINRGKRLYEGGRFAESFALLARAKFQQPYFAYTDSAYAAARFRVGDVTQGRKYALAAWLKWFDYIRFANCYLFYSAYDDIPEEEIAAEHAFWAATLAPAPVATPSPKCDLLLRAMPPRTTEKIRLAYWSPDIRNHSVRYFLRPMLECHDRSRFEIMLLSDFPVLDAETDKMKALCDHFIDVYALPDPELLHLLKSLELDVLVELAGQSSYNRPSLLQERLAKVQLSGLGYPPTTGLATIDGKFLDPYSVGPQPSFFYTEGAFILPESFWCFDPGNHLPQPNPEPPSVRSGKVTFACIGNTSKISARMLDSWKTILDAVADSRLLVRCLYFDDPAIADYFRDRAARHGIAPDRLIIRGPLPSIELFLSYEEVDVVLDTFPFNGGTTSCFATYMGVPVVTLAGKSLISRMGASIMQSLGASDLVASSMEQYVAAAIRVAQDTNFLRFFRSQARNRFRGTHLGDGRGFTRAFENLCEQTLSAPDPKIKKASASVQPIPERELVRRASACLGWGQREACGRIVEHCLSIYPNSAGAHILSTQTMTDAGKFHEAAVFLLQRLGRFPPDEQAAALLNAMRCLALARREEELEAATRQAGGIVVSSALDRLHLRLYQSRLNARGRGTPDQHTISADPLRDSRILVVLPCDDDQVFARLRAAYLSLTPPTSKSIIEIRRCRALRKTPTYRQSLVQSEADIVIWAQCNAIPSASDLLIQLQSSLQAADAVGIAGARQWDRIDWRASPSSKKAGCFLAASTEVDGLVDVHVLGHSADALVTNLKVIDGSLVAMRREAFVNLADSIFAEALENANTLLEEYAFQAASQQGATLAAHQALGVYMDSSVSLPAKYLSDARWELGQLLSLDPFDIEPDEIGTLAVPVDSVKAGVALQRCAFPVAHNTA